MIPELASLGHSRYITHARPDLNDLAESNDLFTSLCPVDPRTREIVGALLDEVCELFDDELVHVGLDEVKFGEHPLTGEALKTRSASDLFTDHILFLHDRLARNGRRMMMWGDHLLLSPEIAAAIPKDILVANWQYDPNFSEKTTTTLQRAGFEVVSCPALISAYQFPFPGNKYALPNLEKTARHAAAQQTQGVITTLWLPQRYISGALWASVHYTAELMNRGGEVALPESLGRFAESFHGMKASDRWIDAMLQMFEHAPGRHVWTAALEMRLDHELDGINLADQANIWHKIHETLSVERGAVQREQESYDTLAFLAEVIAHVWDRAARMQAGTLDRAVLDRSAEIYVKLEATWDVEKFADDPLKYKAKFHFDYWDYLVVMFDRGTKVAAEAV